jgi:hypothetical protein
MLHLLLHLLLGSGTHLLLRGLHLLLRALHLLRVGEVFLISRGRRAVSRLNVLPLLWIERAPRIMLHSALLLLE